MDVFRIAQLLNPCLAVSYCQRFYQRGKTIKEIGFQASQKSLINSYWLQCFKLLHVSKLEWKSQKLI